MVRREMKVWLSLRDHVCTRGLANQRGNTSTHLCVAATGPNWVPRAKRSHLAVAVPFVHINVYIFIDQCTRVLALNRVVEKDISSRGRWLQRRRSVCDIALRYKYSEVLTQVHISEGQWWRVQIF